MMEEMMPFSCSTSRHMSECFNHRSALVDDRDVALGGKGAKPKK